MKNITARPLAYPKGLALAWLLWMSCCYGDTAPPALEIPAANSFMAPASEGEIAQWMTEAVKQGGAGAINYLYRRKVMPLTNGQALSTAQQNNLAIQATLQDKEIAKEFLRESKAAFNPIFILSGSHDRTDSFGRSRLINRARALPLPRSLFGDELADLEATRDQTIDNEDGTLTSNNANRFGDIVCITVDGDLINGQQCSLETKPLTKRERASSKSRRTLEGWSFGFGASQLFPWGQSLNVEFLSSYRHKGSFNFGNSLDQPFNPKDPIGRGSDFPWTSSFVANLVSPLPYSKNFGPYGSAANVGVLLSDRSDRRAAWDVEAQANAVLRDVDGAYWELVRTVRQLQITVEQRKVLEALAERANRQFQAQTITTYDKAQTDANLENIKNQEQIAWSNFITSSNRLVELLNYEPDRVILPVGYSGDLLASETKAPLDKDSNEAFDTAMASRPEIKASQIGVESSDILLKHRNTQIRPDLNLNIGVSFNQSNAVLGYRSWEDSMGEVFNPDSSNFFVGISFRIPFDNLAARSALSQARISRNQAMDQSQQTINSVTQEINTVIADAYGSHARIQQTRASLDLAKLAYDKADGLKQQGLVTDFELLRKLSDLLAARSSYLNTLIDYRKTRARLLSAEGVLASQY